jgi:hypothetical protein
MQNRYVADIGDYVKLSILRKLARECGLGVAWWLSPDEHHNADGGHREYLGRPNEWRHFDQDLFDALLRIEREKQRDVRAIEKAEVLPNAMFASDPVPCEAQPFSLRPAERSMWIERVKTKLKNCNLFFLDPDNGIASEQLRLTQRRAGKSVTIEEIKMLRENNRAMVIYHHQTRFQGGHIAEHHHLAVRLGKCGLHVSGMLRAKPWSPRLFLILNGDQELHNRAKSIAKDWGKNISWIPRSEFL